MIKKIYLSLIVLISLALSGCESDIDANSRIRVEFSAAIKAGDLVLAENKIKEYRGHLSRWGNSELSARLAIAKGERKSAKKFLSSCESRECEAIRKELKEKEYQELFAGGLDENEYSSYDNNCFM